MSDSRTGHIKDYLKKVKQANKEFTMREHFKDLLNRLYAGEKEIIKTLDAISKGAETPVIRIPRKGEFHKGSIDTFYNNIIIEYETDLRRKINESKKQLAGYLLSKIHEEGVYNFTLIATDFITWKVFAPDVSQLENLEGLNEDDLILNEIESTSFTLTESNTEDFYFWIDRFLFKEEKQHATLKRIEESFGYQSNTFIECYREISRIFLDAKKFGDVQVSYEQWIKFLRIAYGSFEDKGNDFVIHTYLSVFSKMLAYSILSNDDYISDEEMKGILDGTAFDKYNIRNFVDNDFFHWVISDRNFRNLKKTFRIISQELSTYNFLNVDEDILKGVYQELIDLDTRHALGEYYTPDWLCERIVNEFQFKTTDKILDPACGSGSFLRAAVHRIKQLNPEMTVEQLNENIYGIDIHPLSVQIAKTTMLLALGKEVTKAKKPVHINIILANTLLAPEGVQDLFGGAFQLNIDKEKYKLTTQILDDVKLFDEALDVCEELAEQTMNRKKETQQTFENILKKRYKNVAFSPQVSDSFYKIYDALKMVKEKGRDSIWKFIVQNLYKPYFLNGKFNYVIGNPPWFTFSSIKNEEYQNLLNLLAEKYNVKPVSVKNFPNLEIAAIFLSYCSSYFLKENGEIAFVLPRSFFSADHHDNTRSGKAKGFRLTQIWDLKNTSPVFRIPSGVLFGEKAEVKKALLAKGLKGISISGNLPAHNCNLKTATPKLIEEPVTWFYNKQGKSSAFSTRKTKAQTKVNPYKQGFKRGAELSPRSFYFIQLTQATPTDWEERIINIKTSDAIKADAKAPWKGLDFQGKIESNFIFRTALSKSILPFALFNPDLVVLPITIEYNHEKQTREIILHSVTELMRTGYLNASKWFQNAENIWAIHRTEKNKKIGALEYTNWNNKLESQNLNSPFVVIYNASAKDANATVVERTNIDLEFIVDTKAYAFYTNEKNEAYYLTAILNSTTPNLLMKDFQSRGLFGARDVHKKILDIYYPKFNERDEAHFRLAELSNQAHEKTAEYLKGNPPRELTPIHLGKLRIEIKKHLSKEMKLIDKLVKKIIN